MKLRGFLLCGMCTLLICSCSSLNPKNEIKKNSKAEQWIQADKLFKRSVHWRGSDDAYSIKLGDNRVLWLFGDTLISNKNKIMARNEKYVKMPRNSVGIMHGLNPAKSKINFYWGNNNSTSEPESFFRNPKLSEDHWFWPGNAVLLPDGKSLIAFMMDIKTDKSSAWGFGIAGWQAAKITNIDKTPDKWNIQWLKAGDYSKFEILLGSGGVIIDGDYLYAYGGNNAKIGNRIFLARWPIAAFDGSNIDMSNPEWWTGETTGWVKGSDMDSENLKPVVLWDKGQNEFTVNKMENGRYVMVQTVYSTKGKPGNSNLICRVSNLLTGPWSEQRILYKNLLRDKKVPNDLNVYAGKYHPELKGGDCIFTYATNTQSLKTLWDWQNIYFPRFVKMDREKINKTVNR